MTSFRLLLCVLAALAWTAPSASLAAPICAGRDRSQDADIASDLAAHADDRVNGEGLLWKIERTGLAPSYFYGTIHSTVGAAISLARRSETFIAGARVVATELGDLDAARKVELGSSMLKAAMSPERDTFLGEISPADTASVDAYLAARGYPATMAHHLKLWLLAIATSQPACEIEGEREGLPEVDQMLADFARAHGVPVVGLETIDEQLQTLSSTPDPVAATILVASVRAPGVDDDSYVTLLGLYARERPSAAMAILEALPELTPEARAAGAAFERLLLVGRNETMMKRAAPLLETGGAFVAVGAMHLVGRDGLIERARAAGYRVTNVW